MNEEPEILAPNEAHKKTLRKPSDTPITDFPNEKYLKADTVSSALPKLDETGKVKRHKEASLPAIQPFEQY